MIIALGESLIVAATAISNVDRTAALMAEVVAGLVVVCLLWWSYFGWLKEAMEHGLAAAEPSRVGTVARDAFSVGHFPLVCGIIGVSVAVEEMVHHPTGTAPGEVVAALGVGVGLFVGAAALAYWRTCGRVLGARLAILALTEVVLVLVSGADPVWLLTTVAVGMLAIVAVEAVTHRETPAEHALGSGDPRRRRLTPGRPIRPRAGTHRSRSGRRVRW